METGLLSRADLNLLVALQVLFEEKNVTKAAERLFITQPAMSKTLNRLRELFGDQLFTRSGRSLVPTPRANELAAALPGILGNIRELIERDTFDSSSYEGFIRILITEFVGHKLISRLTQMLAEESPGLTVVAASETPDMWRELGDGSLDFSIAVARREPKDIIATPLFTLQPMVWMRAEHPLAEKEQPSLKELLKYPFVQYFLFSSSVARLDSEARVDRALANKGLARRRLLVTNQFMTAIETLSMTNTIMMAAMDEEVGMRMSGHGIVQKPYPVEFGYTESVAVMLNEHVRTAQSPMHKWVRTKIRAIVADSYPRPV